MSNKGITLVIVRLWFTPSFVSSGNSKTVFMTPDQYFIVCPTNQGTYLVDFRVSGKIHFRPKTF